MPGLLSRDDQDSILAKLSTAASKLKRTPAGPVEARILNLFGVKNEKDLVVEFILPLQTV